MFEEKIAKTVKDIKGDLVDDKLIKDAQEIASYALETFTGGLLRKALDISIAISEFSNELSDKEE